MEISYDKEEDALYITLKKGTFARNKKVDDHTILDLDENGDILGIEILSASTRLPPTELAEVRVKNIVAMT
jgi:uncharacterized protein YuzE